jgi:hypothetical protein
MHFQYVILQSLHCDMFQHDSAHIQGEYTKLKTIHSRLDYIY